MSMRAVNKRAGIQQTHWNGFGLNSNWMCNKKNYKKIMHHHSPRETWCCSLNFLPSYFRDSDEEFNVVRYRRTSKTKRAPRSGTIILDRHNKKVLVIQSYKRFWGFPKGHVEENETMEQCAIRETSEETGISLRETDLLRSYTVYNGDGVYFIVNGNDLSYNLERMTSTEEITGINWLCLRCLDRYMRVNEIIVNSHFRALIPIIRRELYELES